MSRKEIRQIAIIILAVVAVAFMATGLVALRRMGDPLPIRGPEADPQEAAAIAVALKAPELADSRRRRELRERWNALPGVQAPYIDYRGNERRGFVWEEGDFPHPTLRGGDTEAYRRFGDLLSSFLDATENQKWVSENPQWFSDSFEYGPIDRSGPPFPPPGTTRPRSTISFGKLCSWVTDPREPLGVGHRAAQKKDVIGRSLKYDLPITFSVRKDGGEQYFRGVDSPVKTVTEKLSLVNLDAKRSGGREGNFEVYRYTSKLRDWMYVVGRVSEGDTFITVSAAIPLDTDMGSEPVQIGTQAAYRIVRLLEGATLQQSRDESLVLQSGIGIDRVLTIPTKK